MSKAQLVIAAVVVEGRSKSEVARDYDVSRQSELTPVAVKVCTPTTRPFSRTLSTSASAATNVYGPASRGRVRNASTYSSSSVAMTETCDLERLVTPRD
jgi:hypothetical protein